MTDAEHADLKPFLERFFQINHDLNNPLSGIMGYAEFLLEESQNLTPDQLDHVKQIIACAERMSTIIADFCEAKEELAEHIDISAYRFHRQS